MDYPGINEIAVDSWESMAYADKYMSKRTERVGNKSMN